MTITSKNAGGGMSAGSGPGLMLTGASRSTWGLSHNDAKATPVTADGGSPLNVAQTGAGWVEVPEGAVRAYLRARSTAGGAKTTAPIVTIVGYRGSNPASIDAGQIEIIDSGITVTLDKDHDDNVGSGATWDFGTPVRTNASGEEIDLYNARWVLVLVTTAAAGPTDVDIQVCFLN